MPYPTLPTLFSETYGSPIASTAKPLNQRMKGGVEQNSTTGLINVTTTKRDLRFWVKTSDYTTAYAFIDNLKGKPFGYQGKAYRITGESWNANSLVLWELNLDVEQVFNPG